MKAGRRDNLAESVDRQFIAIVTAPSIAETKENNCLIYLMIIIFRFGIRIVPFPNANYTISI